RSTVRMCSVGSAAVTTALPFNGGKTPGSPSPVSWWQAAHLFSYTCLPSAAHDGWLAAPDAAGPRLAGAAMAAIDSRYALNSMAPYHMLHATMERNSTQAQVGIGAGVSARTGSKLSPGRLAKALTSSGTRPRIVSPSDRPTTAMPGPLRTVKGISST